jgi:protein-S-isoprenylcysteine O-methyltransferase Ste14
MGCLKDRSLITELRSITSMVANPPAQVEQVFPSWIFVILGILVAVVAILAILLLKRRRGTNPTTTETVVTWNLQTDTCI